VTRHRDLYNYSLPDPLEEEFDLPSGFLESCNGRSSKHTAIAADDRGLLPGHL
jgi:hypothetical protein